MQAVFIFFRNIKTEPAMGLPENITKIRTSKGISQKDLAGAARISKRSLIRYERGKCRPHYLVADRIARALDVTVNDLLK